MTSETHCPKRIFGDKLLRDNTTYDTCVSGDTGGRDTRARDRRYTRAKVDDARAQRRMRPILTPSSLLLEGRAGGS